MRLSATRTKRLAGQDLRVLQRLLDRSTAFVASCTRGSTRQSVWAYQDLAVNQVDQWTRRVGSRDMIWYSALPQRTQYIPDSSVGPQNAALTSIQPFVGQLPAHRITPTTVADWHRVGCGTSSRPQGAAVCVSVYVRPAAGTRYCALSNWDGGSNEPVIEVDFQTKTFVLTGATSGGMLEVWPGVWRIWVVGVSANASSGDFALYCTRFKEGVAGVPAAYLDYSCPQLELGSFPSAPIVATTTAVTSLADQLTWALPSGQAPDQFGQGEVVWLYSALDAAAPGRLGMTIGTETPGTPNGLLHARHVPGGITASERRVLARLGSPLGDIGTIRAMYRSLVGLINRARIAGRDGQVTEARGTQRTSCFDGSIVAAATPVQSTLLIGDQSIPCFAAFGQATNWLPWSSAFESWSLGNDAQPSCTAVSGYPDPFGGTSARRFTPGVIGNVPLPFATSANRAWIELDAPAGTTWTQSIWVRSAGATGSFALMAVDHASDNLRNSVTITTSAEWQRVTLTTVMPFSGIRFLFASEQVVDVVMAQAEQASVVSPPIPTAGAAVTQNADQLNWTLPSPLSTVAGETLLLRFPYGYDGTVGGRHGYAVFAVDSDMAWNELQFAQTGTADDAQWSRGTRRLASNVSVACTSESRALQWRADGSMATYLNGNALADTGPGAATFGAVSAIRIGSGQAGDGPARDAIVLLYVEGGITPAERQAFEYFRPQKVAFP